MGKLEGGWAFGGLPFLPSLGSPTCPFPSSSVPRLRQFDSVAEVESSSPTRAPLPSVPSSIWVLILDFFQVPIDVPGPTGQVPGSNQGCFVWGISVHLCTKRAKEVQNPRYQWRYQPSDLHSRPHLFLPPYHSLPTIYLMPSCSPNEQLQTRVFLTTESLPSPFSVDIHDMPILTN